VTVGVIEVVGVMVGVIDGVIVGVGVIVFVGVKEGIGTHDNIEQGNPSTAVTPIKFVGLVPQM
jgi:hypothetical protein